MKKVGHWQQCTPMVEHKQVDVMFWKTPDYVHNFCHMCLYAVQKRNGTLVTSNQFRTMKSIESKPEKDTL